jgi:nicotinamide-nucleotide amidase
MPNPFDKNSINKIKDQLIKKKETIAVAESVTAGLLQVALASADEAIQFFQGGMTAYNLGQKSRHLQVDPIYALACNCVDTQVAQDMALNVCKLFSSDWGIGITGYSSAVPESGNKLFCFYAIAHNNKIVLKNKVTAVSGSPFNVQVKYVQEVLAALLKQTAGK